MVGPVRGWEPKPPLSPILTAPFQEMFFLCLHACRVQWWGRWAATGLCNEECIGLVVWTLWWRIASRLWILCTAVRAFNLPWVMDLGLLHRRRWLLISGHRLMLWGLVLKALMAKERLASSMPLTATGKTSARPPSRLTTQSCSLCLARVTEQCLSLSCWVMMGWKLWVRFVVLVFWMRMRLEGIWWIAAFRGATLIQGWGILQPIRASWGDYLMQVWCSTQQSLGLNRSRCFACPRRMVDKDWWWIAERQIAGLRPPTR